MIRQLTGTVSYVGDHDVVIDVGGVGYRLYAPQTTLARATNEATLSLWTHLSVRETSLELFGFESRRDLDLFEMLINVSGVGPRSAVAILNLAPVEHLTQAIASGDSGYLTKVSGIGRKSAEKIVVELRDRLSNLALETTDTTHLREEADALEALQALGYTTTDARVALREITDTSLDTNAKIKEALRILGENSVHSSQ